MTPVSLIGSGIGRKQNYPQTPGLACAYEFGMGGVLRKGILFAFFGSALSLAGSAALRAEEDAVAIMTKMAANTSSAAEVRRQYVYQQKIRSSIARGSELLCRESREYTVTPQRKKTQKTLVSFSGECRQGKKMVPYSRPDSPTPGARDPSLKEKDGNDAVSVESDSRATIAGVANDLASDPHSRDGIPRQLFPLSPGELKYYTFTSKGETVIQGRRAYQIAFDPRWHQNMCIDLGDGDPTPGSNGCFRPWKGTVWVDAQDYQPIRIDTQLARGIPWGVRVFMGINLRQLGFSLTYQRVAEGVWFPATYGTEFGVTVFWAYKRTITMSMENTDFRKTDAQSTIQFDSPDQ